MGGQPPWGQRPRSGKVCGFCFQSCSSHATGLPQLVKTQTISQTSSPLPEEGPRTKSQVLSSLSGVPRLPSQEDWEGSQKGHTVALDLCSAPLSWLCLQQPREEVPGTWQCGQEEGSRGDGAFPIGPSYTAGANKRPRWGSCLDYNQ